MHKSLIVPPTPDFTRIANPNRTSNAPFVPRETLNQLRVTHVLLSFKSNLDKSTNPATQHVIAGRQQNCGIRISRSCPKIIPPTTTTTIKPQTNHDEAPVRSAHNPGRMVNIIVCLCTLTGAGQERGRHPGPHIFPIRGVNNGERHILAFAKINK